jgi:hypothetical protein
MMVLNRCVIFWLLSTYFITNASADWQQASYIVDSFFEIALKNEYSEKGKVVKKWSSTGIRYYYVHRVLDNGLHEELTERHLLHLQNITGLPIQSAKSIKDANLIIVFSQEASLKDDLQNFFDMGSASERTRFFRDSVCLGHFSTQLNGSIQKAVVIIPVDRARKHGKLMACVVEELTQVMGLTNDSITVSPSIFNDRSRDHFLTGLDYILLKILYDQRLHIGMRKTEAMPVVQSIVAEYFQKGLIESADRTVRSSGLYELRN